jgi:hypothetical protein
MSDTPEVPPAEQRPAAAEPTEPAPPDPPPPERPRVAGVLVLGGIIAVGLLVAAVAYLVERPAPAEVDPARVAALEGQLGALRQRVDALEKRPAPAAQPLPDLRPLDARIAALEQRPAAAPQPAPDLGPLQSRLDALRQRVADLARLQAASLALATGQPLGAWPDAPAALARFATAQPPTEGELRLDFAPAARRAAEASKPATPSGSLAERMWSRVASLVTVREGGRVLVGAPASTVLDAARARLDAGDLAGAVAALDALDPGAAAAMADWRGRAQSLLDARAALAKLAQG